MLTAHVVRLHPRQDLLVELENFAGSRGIEAACVLTCVGSLTRAVLRYANRERAVAMEDYFEIVSLTGTLSKFGSHFHIVIANDNGRTFGAHLLAGCRVYTTAEIVLAVLPGIRFLRAFDELTGYPELVIDSNSTL